MPAVHTSAVGGHHLLEREAALDALDAGLSEARTGAGRLALVAGEAGVGKTALVRAFCAANSARARILVGACDPLFTPRPLGPLADIAEATDGELQKLVCDGKIPYLIAAALMEELRRERPTVLVLEDLHWADEATLDVFRLVARRVENLPALLVATYRDEGLDANHPLRVVLGGLASVRAIRRMRVEPLSPVAVAALAEPYSADPDELYRMTSGNPFFVTEVLAGDLEEIPETVRDAVLARAAGLSSDARAILEAVSIVPDRVEPWLLEALVQPTDGALDECLISGMLTMEKQAVRFRHELARLTVQDSLTPERRRSLHRSALKALGAQPLATRDFARLAHHSDAAGDSDAVLGFAPEAAVRASSLGAHREAAAQLGRALRYANGLPLEVRAGLLRRYSHECYLTDGAEEAIDSLRAAAYCYRELGDRRREGATLSTLANILWCPGRCEEAREVGMAAVALLERCPLGPELVQACDVLSFLHAMNADLELSSVWGDRALELAERLELEEATSLRLIGAATRDVRAGATRRLKDVDRGIELAKAAGDSKLVSGALLGSVFALTYHGPATLAGRYIEEGLEYSREHGFDLDHIYALAFRSELELEHGRWTEAAELAELVLSERFVSTFPRTIALVTLGVVRLRRGDPDVAAVLDEALALAEPTRELQRIAPVAAARAEAGWLTGQSDIVAHETAAAYELARKRRAPWAIGELATVRWRAGVLEDVPDDAAEPHRLQISGDWQGAAELWSRLDCPYESALALADSDDKAALRRALDELRRLGARPAAYMVARRLREHGVRGVPRGPRPSTQASAAGLTIRETEVLGLVAQGLRNTEIAERLHLSTRTVDHHVSAVLRKLDARTRGEAVAEAARLDLLQDR